MISRRSFLYSVTSAYLATTGCSRSAFAKSFTGGTAVNAGEPGKFKRPAASQGLGAQIGCYLNADAADSADLPSLSISSGNLDLDKGLTHEWEILSSRVGVRPALYMYDDAKGGNAFATPHVMGPRPFPDGTVCFGFRLMQEEFASAGPQGRGDHALAGILAHEWAHILQFRKLSSYPPGKPMELCADQIAGWYMGTRSAELRNAVDLTSAFNTFVRKGDIAINSPQHHGTPEERGAAFQRGIAMANLVDDIDDAFARARDDTGL